MRSTAKLVPAGSARAMFYCTQNTFLPGNSYNAEFWTHVLQKLERIRLLDGSTLYVQKPEILIQLPQKVEAMHWVQHVMNAVNNKIITLK